MSQLDISEEMKENIEKHRKFWKQIAEQHDWYTEPFYVQVWVRDDGSIVDSVAHIGMTSDVIVAAEE